MLSMRLFGVGWLLLLLSTLYWRLKVDMFLCPIKKLNYPHIRNIFTIPTMKTISLPIY